MREKKKLEVRHLLLKNKWLMISNKKKTTNNVGKCEFVNFMLDQAVRGEEKQAISKVGSMIFSAGILRQDYFYSKIFMFWKYFY